MAETLLKNYGDFQGLMGTNPVEFTSSIAEVTIIDGLVATKTADKEFWVNGELLYTIVVSNASDNLPFSGGSFSDTLDGGITLVENSVKIDGSAVSYTFAANVLTIGNLPEIAPGEEVTITFSVVQV